MQKSTQPTWNPQWWRRNSSWPLIWLSKPSGSAWRQEKGSTLSFLASFLSSGHTGWTSWGCRWFGANIPNGALTPAPRFWEGAEETLCHQAGKYTPKQNNTKNPTPKTFHLQTCFRHCQRFRIATCRHLWPQTRGLWSLPKAPKIKNAFWQKQ